MVFDKNWFTNHQDKLLFLLNAPVIKHWFRWVLEIKSNKKICELQPDNYKEYLGLFLTEEGLRHKIRADFRTHNKYAKRLFHAFYPLWAMFHIWDLFADHYVPSYSFGFLTLTVYPDAGTAGPGSDSYFIRSVVSEAFSTIRGGAGTGHGETDTNNGYVSLDSSAVLNQFSALIRSGFTFDTSSLGGSAVISAAVLSLFGISQNNGLGSPSIDITGFTPATNFSFADSDYGNFAATSFANIAYASYSTTAYNDFTLDANGRNNISLTGISRFGARSNWDTGNSFTGTWAGSQSSSLRFYLADQTGTTNDPKLVVTYTVTASSFIPKVMIF